MNVAILVEYLNERGGTQRQALELARHLGQSGHRATVYTRLWHREACFPEITAKLHVRAADEISARPRPPPVASRARRAARTLARSTGLVYLANYATMRQSAANFLTLCAGSVQDCDVLNPHDFGAAAWVAAELGKTRHIPVVWQCNDPLLRWGHAPPMARPLQRWLVNLDKRRVVGINQTTVLDHRVAAVVQARHGGTPVVVRSGVELERFANLPAQAAARQRFHVAIDARVALVLAMLNSPHRRVEDAIASHAQGPEDVVLVLACPAAPSAPYADVVAQQIAASPARDRIVWLRQHLHSDDDLGALLACADVLIFPNVQQTWGLAAIEAAAAGLPVVISDGAGASEVFRNHETAFVYPGGDADALTATLQRVWDDAALRKQVAVRGCAMVRQSLSWQKYTTAMLRVFDSVRSAP